jgi:hypothetical protein
MVRLASSLISSSLSSGEESTRIASGSASKDQPPSRLRDTISRRLSAGLKPFARSRRTAKYYPETHAPSCQRGNDGEPVPAMAQVASIST